MKSLRALAIFVAASSLVVSCYDDSALRTEISGVKNDLKDVKARLDSLENTLSSQIEAVQNLYAAIEASKEEVEGALGELGGSIEAVAGQILVAEVKTNDNGKVEVVLTNGSTFVLEPASKNTNPIVTVKTDADGNKYWALVNPATGEASVIEINNAPVAVAHPGFKIRFNDDTRCVEVSVDGGATWTETDVVIPEQEEIEIPECSALITEVDTWSEEGYALFYTVWDEVIKVPVAQEFTFSVKSGKLSFAYGATKEVAVSINNVTDYVVMTKPEGWKATFVGETLVVTAPSEEAIKAGAAEESGIVRVHVSTADGKCKVAKLAVTVLPGLAVSVDMNGNITVVNPFGGLDMNYGMYMFDYYYLGVTTDIAAFEADQADFIENMDWNFETYGGYPYNFNEFEEKMLTYDPELNPVDTLKIGVAEYAGMCYSPAPERGQAAIVFVLAADATGQLDPESLAFTYYEPMEATVIVDTTATTWNEAVVEAHMYGYDRYEYGYAMSEDELYAGFMNWQMYFQYGVSIGETVAFKDGSYEGTLSGFGVNGDVPAGSLMPSTTYYAYVLGVNEGMDPKSITWEEFRANNVVEVTTKSLVAGAAATSEAEFTPDYTKVTAEITASDDAYMVWYGFFNASAITEGMTNEELVGLLLNSGYSVLATELPATFTTEQARLTLGSGTAVKFVSVAVDADGQYGAVKVQDTATKTFVYSETFEVSAEDPTYYLNGTYASVYVKFAAEGGNIKKIRYRNVKVTDATYTDEYMAKDMPVNNKSTYTTVDVSTLPGGILKLSSVAKGEWRLGFIAYDENDEVAAYQSVVYSVAEEADLSGNILLKDDADYATSKPTCKFTEVNSGSKYYFKYSVEVDVPEGCMAWVGIGKSTDAEEKYTSAAQLVNVIAAGGLQSKHYVGKFTQDFNFVYDTYNFYLVWVDANGKYHEAEIIPYANLAE